MNDYVRNVKLYQMVKEKWVTFCCVTKLLDLQQQVFILTLMSLSADWLAGFYKMSLEGFDTWILIKPKLLIVQF